VTDALKGQGAQRLDFTAVVMWRDVPNSDGDVAVMWLTLVVDVPNP
jgi:hypothetical protein